MSYLTLPKQCAWREREREEKTNSGVKSKVFPSDSHWLKQCINWLETIIAIPNRRKKVSQMPLCYFFVSSPDFPRLKQLLWARLCAGTLGRWGVKSVKGSSTGPLKQRLKHKDFRNGLTETNKVLLVPWSLFNFSFDQ